LITKKIIIALALSALFLGACERAQVTTYQQGKYQGKTDAQPWNNAKYANNKEAWENDMKARNQNQNEYKRTN
jgi:PBP1b-binding outer membrane lipoprotein LpoB